MRAMTASHPYSGFMSLPHRQCRAVQDDRNHGQKHCTAEHEVALARDDFQLHPQQQEMDQHVILTSI